MKKLVLILGIVIPGFTFAQINKGGIFIGGTLSTSLYSTNDWSPNSSGQTVNNRFSISPNLGFIVSDRSAVGFSVGYSTSHQESKYIVHDIFGDSPATIKYTINYYSGGFFVRNLFQLSDKFYFSLHNQIGFSRGTIKIENSIDGVPTPLQKDEVPSYNVTIGTRPVFIFFPSTKWGIEAGIGHLGYLYSRNLPDVSHSSTFDLSFGSFSLGVSYYPIKK